MIGERLRRLRKSRNITQEELAQILNLQKSTISIYEKDKSDPSDKIKIDIARYFNISVDYLLGLTDEAIPFYSEKMFIKLPECFSDEDRLLTRDFIEFLCHRKRKND